MARRWCHWAASLAYTVQRTNAPTLHTRMYGISRTGKSNAIVNTSIPWRSNKLDAPSAASVLHDPPRFPYRMLPVRNVRRRNISVNRLSIYVLATALFAGTAQAAPPPSTNAATTYHRVQVDGVGIFYREAGPEN